MNVDRIILLSQQAINEANFLEAVEILAAYLKNRDEVLRQVVLTQEARIREIMQEKEIGYLAAEDEAESWAHLKGTLAYVIHRLEADDKFKSS